MAVNRRSVAWLALGFTIGLFAGALLAGVLLTHNPDYVVTQELQIAGPGHMDAVIHPGSKFSISMRKGDVNYVEFPAIVFDRDLVGHAKCTVPGREDPWEYKVVRQKDAPAR
jgi:hypothetical protein